MRNGSCFERLRKRDGHRTNSLPITDQLPRTNLQNHPLLRVGRIVLDVDLALLFPTGAVVHPLNVGGFDVAAESFAEYGCCECCALRVDANDDTVVVGGVLVLPRLELWGRVER